MKNRLVSLACFAAILCLLAGCASPTPGVADGAASAPDPAGSRASQTAMGRYVERAISDVELPAHSNGEQNLKQVGGKTYAITDDGATLWVSEDLVEWTQRPSGHAFPDGDILQDFAVAEDGTLFLLATRFEGGRRASSLQRVRDGAATAVDLPTVGGSTPTLRDVEMLPSGNLLVQTIDQGLLQIGPDGALVRQYPVAGSRAAFDAHGDELAVLSPEDATIVIVGLADGVEQRRLPRPSAAQDGGCLRYDAQGALLYADATGIYRVVPGGSLFERIVDGALCTLSDPTSIVDRILFDARGRIALSYARFPQTRFIAYEFDESVPTEPQHVVNLFSLDESYAMQKAISTYQDAHPDVMVRWTVALSPDTAVTADDAIRALNTEVLAGKGPDVFVLDGLPVASYIRKGILADLSGVVQPLLDEGDAFAPIVDAFREGDERCAVPTRFSLPALFGDVQGVATLEDLARQARNAADVPPFVDMSPEALLRAFSPSSMPAWRDDSGRMRADAVGEFLAQMRALRGDWTTEAARAAIPEDARDVDGLTLLGYGIVTLAVHTLHGGHSVSQGMGALHEARKGGYMALPGQARGAYAPRCILGVNAASAQPELCRALVQTVLGADIQGMTVYRDGFPVRTSAFDALLAAERSNDDVLSVGGKGGSYISTGIAPDAAMVAWVRSMADDAAACSLPDEALLGMLVEETRGFFEGTASAEQAAQAFVNRANAYLTE